MAGATPTMPASTRRTGDQGAVGPDPELPPARNRTSTEPGPSATGTCPGMAIARASAQHATRTRHHDSVDPGWKMTTPNGELLRELDEYLTLHPSLVLLPFEVEYLDLIFPHPAAPGAVAPVVAPAQLAAQNDDDENA